MTIDQTIFAFQRQDEFRHLVSFPDTPSAESISRYREELALLMLKEDIQSGLLPASIRSLSDVDEYTDSNMYLIDDEHPHPKARTFFDWPELQTMDIVEVVCQLRNRIDQRLPDMLGSLPELRTSADVLTVTRSFCR